MQNRLVIYFHYDPHGVLDAASRMVLLAMQRVGRVILVTNGTLAAESAAWVHGASLQLRERQNQGYDVGAYREVLLSLDRQGVQGLDELVLMNYTLAGPVHPIEEMFKAMQARPELDFWGLSRHYAMRSRRFGGKVPEHLQSHFLALRPRLLQSDAFWQYWQKMPLPKSYEESVILHEVKFTAHFAELGFCWDSYLQTQDLQGAFVNPLMACPREMLAKRGCPFFKRRSFFTPYADELRRTDGTAARALYDYLKEETDYPVDLLLQSLLRTQPLGALAQNLHWHAVLERGHNAETMGEELLVLRFEPSPTKDAVLRYYLEQAVQRAQRQRSAVVELFARDPMLAMAAPALPLWHSAGDWHAAQWRAAYTTLAQLFPDAPLNRETPLPLPACGWVMVRKSAFGTKLPEETDPHAIWKLQLLAAQNGWKVTTFEEEAQAAARAELLSTANQMLHSKPALLHQLARLVKRSLTR